MPVPVRARLLLRPRDQEDVVVDPEGDKEDEDEQRDVLVHPREPEQVLEGQIARAHHRQERGDGDDQELRATITRATPIERLWTRMTGDFGFMELCEFSFSDEVTP